MTTEKKLIFIILISLLLIFLLIFIILRPAFLEVKDLSVKIEKEQQDLEELYQRGKTLSQVKDELKKIGDKKEILNEIFWGQNKELEFITTLEKISSQNNITQNVSLREQQGYQDKYKIMTVGLSLTGGFQNLIKYLQAIENLNFYFNITSFSINSLSNKDNQLEISLEANTYWYK
jgi:Tfp pilus assembly protein PilO